MTEGHVQLAMDESDGRKKRDAHAIHWVIDNLTEDSELEPFVLGIPGLLNLTWGKRVWETVATGEENTGNILSHAFDQPDSAPVLQNPGPSPVQPVTMITSSIRKIKKT